MTAKEAFEVVYRVLKEGGTREEFQRAREAQAVVMEAVKLERIYHMKDSNHDR